MSCKLLIVANLAKLRPVIRRSTSRTSNCRANGLRTNRSSAVGRAAAQRTPARARNARGQQPMTPVAWPLRWYRPPPTLPPPPTRRLDCVISRIASGPRRSVRAGPGRRRIFIRTDLVPAPSTAASCITGTLWPAVGCGGGSLLVQGSGLPRLSTRGVIAQICGICQGTAGLGVSAVSILGGPEGADRSISAGAPSLRPHRPARRERGAAGLLHGPGSAST